MGIFNVGLVSYIIADHLVVLQFVLLGLFVEEFV